MCVLHTNKCSLAAWESESRRSKRQRRTGRPHHAHVAHAGGYLSICRCALFNIICRWCASHFSLGWQRTIVERPSSALACPSGRALFFCGRLQAHRIRVAALTYSAPMEAQVTLTSTATQERTRKPVFPSSLPGSAFDQLSVSSTNY